MYKTDKSNIYSITSNTLKIIAMILMLIDHTGMLFFPQHLIFRILGRIAFPIFAFQVAEGYRHTSNQSKYLNRLFIFALISEIPFNLLTSGSLININNQNVMFTLLFGLILIIQIDKYQKNNNRNNLIIAITYSLVLSFLSTIFNFDYGAMGVMSVAMFFLFKDKILLQLLGLIYINIIAIETMIIPLNMLGYKLYIPIQSFAALAMFPIYFYNGNKGNLSKRIGRYLYYFYPVHMLILVILKALLR